MTLKVTERDKKLLVFLAIFVVVVGLGAGVILPLLSKSQELREELTQAQLEQTEKEQKVLSLSTMEKRKKGGGGVSGRDEKGILWRDARARILIRC